MTILCVAALCGGGVTCDVQRFRGRSALGLLHQRMLGNFPTITRVLLGKIPEDDGKMSYVYDEYVFHYIVEQKLTFLCMADESFKRRVPFAFLDDVKNRFFATYSDQGLTAIAFSMNADFGRTIQKQLEFYNGPQADQFAQVHKKLDDVKHVMVQNIEMVLERGEKLELLVDKSEQLQLDSFRFQKSSKKLRQAMRVAARFWRKTRTGIADANVERGRRSAGGRRSCLRFWKKVKIYLLVTGVVLLLLYIFLAIICGPTFEKCGNK